MSLCAFLTMDSLDDFFTYDELLTDPLADLGWEVEFASWRNTEVDWNRYDAVVIRSPWDYQDDPELFLEVLEQIDKSNAHLENKLELVNWNISKTYLLDMESRGLPIVPTRWEKSWNQVNNIDDFFKAFDTQEIIIKPEVSANADYTFRLSQSNIAKYQDELEATFRNRPFMIQPFLKNIITEGEFSLFYFGNEYSHAILKKPASGDFRVQEEHGGSLHSVEPDSKLRSIGDQTLKHIDPLPLYSRIDFVRLADGSYALMELELIEPSLYFNMDPDSPKRFARVFHEWMQSAK